MSEHDTWQRLLGETHDLGAQVQDLARRIEALHANIVDPKPDNPPTNVMPAGNFRFSQRSSVKLEGVNPLLVKVMRRAIEITTVDFAVIQGRRTVAEQRRLYDSGASQTMNSRHISGDAVDVGAWLDGTIRWEAPLYYAIATAVQAADKELGAGIRWGGCWQLLSAIGDPKGAVEAYAAERRSQGRTAFIDAGHFEIPA